MSVLPRKDVDAIQYLQDRIAPWNTHHTALGLATGTITSLDTLTTAARDAYDAQQAAQAAAKAATLTYTNAVAAMRLAGQGCIDVIRMTAETTQNPDVYALALIPPPATPSPRPEPGTPTDLSLALDGAGGLILTWTCPNPPGTSGTVYQIFRNDTGSITGPFTSLGLAGEKKFLDTSVPAGATAVVYKIRAVRSTSAGLWGTFNVVFGANTGTGGGGAMVTAVRDPNAPKLAA